jgi:hypothetical protein
VKLEKKRKEKKKRREKKGAMVVFDKGFWDVCFFFIFC